MFVMRDSKALLLILGTLAIGVIAGAVTAVVGQWFYLIVLSPVLATILTGLTGHSLIGMLGVHRPKFAGVVVAVAGVVTMLTILVASHSLLRASLISELSGSQGVSDAAIQAFVTERMNEMTDSAGPLAGPVALRLYAGVRLVGETVVDLGPILNGLMLLAELFACGYLGWRLGSERAAELWCGHCDRWYARRQVGTAALGAAGSVQAELQNEHFHRLGRRMALARDRHLDPVVLHAWMCDTCDSGDVRFELEITEQSGRPHLIKTVVAPHSALEAILDSQALKYKNYE